MEWADPDGMWDRGNGFYGARRKGCTREDRGSLEDEARGRGRGSEWSGDQRMGERREKVRRVEGWGWTISTEEVAPSCAGERF